MKGKLAMLRYLVRKKFGGRGGSGQDHFFEIYLLLQNGFSKSFLISFKICLFDIF